MKTVVITFGTEEYKGSLEILRHSALKNGGADECIVFREQDVADFFEQNPRHLENSRGYGWWAWKPYLILKVMRERPDGDVIVYCDSAMQFQRPLASYVSQTKPITLTRLGGWSTKDLTNRRWTKPSVFEAMAAPEHVQSEVQVNAAFQVYKNCADSRAFVEDYLRWCSDLSIVNDDGKETAKDVVEDTRHDQSILSVLASKHPDDVEFFDDVTQYGQQDPPKSEPKLPPLLNHHRRRFSIPKIAVITPTIGGKYLEECVQSVQRSTLPGIEHWIVIDGKEHEDRVKRVLQKFENRHPIIAVTLPKNVGAGGWCGHRVCGSFPWLVDADYVSFLDDDNTVDPSHYKDLVESCITKNVPWAYSLRRIIDENGAHVCDDNCESLGGISHTVMGKGDYLVDTSCYLLERNLAVSASTEWNKKTRIPGQMEADRSFAQTLLSSAPHAVVRKHSVAYRVGSTNTSVSAKFFTNGNAIFGYDFAKKPDVYVFHFSPQATEKFLATRRKTDRSYALDEWQPNTLRGLDVRYNLINGYSNHPNIPPGATVLVTLCNPGDAPLDMLKARKDLHRVVYTVESPNVRHRAQWDAQWLAEHFDVVATYWKPLLDNSSVQTTFAAHNCHHGDFDNPLDREALLRQNRGKNRNCVMVLERRPELFATREYIINGVELRCLDHMREDLVRGLRDVTVFGINWGPVADGKHIKLGHELHRSVDPRSSVDIIQDYDFVVIVENTNAEGYASEKFYDALSAGAIPLYYGSLPFDIPEGPGGVYIDLKKRGITNGTKLQEFLDLLGESEIFDMKRRIVDTRESILRLVDVHAIADSVDVALKKRKNDK